MRYMYTRTPDEGCHEVESGIYGRPVRTDQQGMMRKKGWSYSIEAQRGTNHVREEKEGREEEVEVTYEVNGQPKQREPDYDALVEEYKAAYGKAPHWKMKPETIRQKLEQADD